MNINAENYRKYLKFMEEALNGARLEYRHKNDVNWVKWHYLNALPGYAEELEYRTMPQAKPVQYRLYSYYLDEDKSNVYISAEMLPSNREILGFIEWIGKVKTYQPPLV